MRNNMRKNWPKIITVGILALLLVAIRAFEDFLFYDPFSAYFKNDYLHLAFPEYDGFELFLNLFFRYFLNAILSLGIIYVLFNDSELTRFTTVLYGILFAILIFGFFGILAFSDHENNFALFYIRRFLIQPLFLLLFVPAFYYQSRISKK